MNLYPFRRKNDRPLEDDLDAWLNTRTEERPDNQLEPEGESLIGDAHEFHVWADVVQQRDLDAQGPADDLWNKILLQQRTVAQKRRAEVMTSIAGTQDEQRLVIAPPKSFRTIRVQESTASGDWRVVAAAALLVLSLAGGRFFAQNGGFGWGGGEDPGRFAAQIVSPEASPDVLAEGCDVEPLTTNEIIAYVENPYSYMPDDVFGTPVPGEEGQTLPSIGLIEASDVVLGPVGGQGEVPDEDTFEDVHSVASQYLSCMYNGTVAQVLTFLRPQDIQDIVFQNLPVYRTEEDVRRFIESVHDLRYGDLNHLLRPVGESVRLDEQDMFVNPEMTDARLFQAGNFQGLHDADMLVYIGFEYRGEDGNMVGLTGWDGTPLVGGLEQTNGGGSLVLVHSDSTDEWYVAAHNAPWG